MHRCIIVIIIIRFKYARYTARMSRGRNSHLCGVNYRKIKTNARGRESSCDAYCSSGNYNNNCKSLRGRDAHLSFERENTRRTETFACIFSVIALKNVVLF